MSFGGYGWGDSFYGDTPSVSYWNTVGSYPTYEQAQAAVDALVSAGFPVEHLQIVGSDLRLVERVTAAMSRGRAAAAGAGAGAWWGLFIGLLIGLFATASSWLAIVVASTAIGAAWGALMALVAHWLSRGRHNFASTKAVVAGRYDVIAGDGLAASARSLLGIAA